MANRTLKALLAKLAITGEVPASTYAYTRLRNHPTAPANDNPVFSSQSATGRAALLWSNFTLPLLASLGNRPAECWACRLDGSDPESVMPRQPTLTG